MTRLYFVAASAKDCAILRAARVDHIMASYAHRHVQAGQHRGFKHIIMDSGAYSEYKPAKKSGDGFEAPGAYDRWGHTITSTAIQKFDTGSPFIEHLANCDCKNTTFHIMLDKIGDQPATVRRYAKHMAMQHKVAFVYYSDAKMTPAVKDTIKLSMQNCGACCFAGTTIRYMQDKGLSWDSAYGAMDNFMSAKGAGGLTHLLGSFKIKALQKFAFTSADVSTWSTVGKFGRFSLFWRDTKKDVRMSQIPIKGSRLDLELDKSQHAHILRSQSEAYKAAKAIGLDLHDEVQRKRWNIRAFKMLEKAITQCQKSSSPDIDESMLFDTSVGPEFWVDEQKALSADMPSWQNDLWPSMDSDTKDIGGAKSIGTGALGGGGKLNPAGLTESGIRPEDRNPLRLKKAGDSQIAEMDENQLLEVHNSLHVEYAKPEHREGALSMHAHVVDALFEKGFAHPPPPDDGFDEMSAEHEAHAEEQPGQRGRLLPLDEEKPAEEEDERKGGEEYDVAKPFPNEHAARQVDPGKFQSFRRGHPAGMPDGVDIIWGITDEGKAEVQSIRFAKDKFTADEAKQWLKDHGLGVEGFEEASDESPGKEVSADVLDGKSVQVTQRARDAFPELCHVCKLGPAAFDIALADQIDTAQSVCLSCLDWRAEHKDVQLDIDILKVDEEQQVMIGIVLEPDEVDAQNDTIKPEVIERAGFNFLADFGKVGGTRLGLMHKKFGDIGLELVMSWIALEDTTINGKPVKKGSWLMGIRATSDAIWLKVKTGALTGFSIGGVASIV